MDHFLMVHIDDPLTVNPYYCVFILKIGIKGWDLLVVLSWFFPTCPTVSQVLGIKKYLRNKLFGCSNNQEGYDG